jgi:hypothetical protein
MELFVKPATNYAGAITVYCIASESSSWYLYYSNPFLGSLPPYCQMAYTFVFGDTAIAGEAAAAPPQFPGAFTNLLLAAFTNGVPESSATNFSASIQWGDDSVTAGTIATNASSVLKQVLGAHDYLYSGNYPIAITITSSLGAATTVSNTITILPSLSLTQSGPLNVLAWPAWAFAYGLQASPDLSGTNWAALTNAAVLSGFQNVVSNAPLASQAFFRLNN